MVRSVALLLSLAAAAASSGCGLEATLGDAVSGGQFVEYVPEPDLPQNLAVRVSDHPGGTVVLGDTTATADEQGWADLQIPHGVNLRFAIVRSGPLAALVPPGATGVTLDDRTTADVQFLQALGGDLQSADGVGLMGLLNTARSRGGAYYNAITRQLLGLDHRVEATLAELTHGKAITPCVDEDRTRVVFQVQMKADMRDGNCAPIDPFRWATDVSDAAMFITGGVHEDFEAANPADALAAHEALGGWLPNVVPLRDGGEGLWSLVVDLPRTSPPLQLGYKYTWGLKGSTWTGTEEWPGNQRLLEVVDVDGDGLVVVRDHFGDEASNKDKQNLRRGGLGSIGYDDPLAREHAVDLDGDCVADAFPAPGDVTPVLGDCADPGPPPALERAGEQVEVHELRGRLFNGGGGVVTVVGAGFRGGQSVLFGGRPSQAVLVRSPTELAAVTPRLATGAAQVEVAGVAGTEERVFGPGYFSGSGDSACRLHDSGGLPVDGDRVPLWAHGTTVTVAGRASSGAIARMELGVGPAGTDPETDEGWEFSPTRYVGPVVLDAVAESEYAADLAIPSTGRWSYGFRLTGDDGDTWRYCDGFGSFEVDGGEG